MTDHAPLTAELAWVPRLRSGQAGDLTFAASSGATAIVVDGDGVAGPSPMQLLAEALAGCMAIDVVLILKKGRHALGGLRITFSGARSVEPPRRFETVTLMFHVTGQVPAEAVARAIALSREKYCSVWHSLRQEIAFDTAFEIHP